MHFFLFTFQKNVVSLHPNPPQVGSPKETQPAATLAYFLEYGKTKSHSIC